MTFTRKNAEDFNSDLRKALKLMEEEYGVVIEVGTLRFNNFGFKVSLEGKAKDATANGKVGQDKLTFALNASALGVDPTWWNKIITPFAKEPMQVVGINLRAPKSPIELVGVNTGKNYKTSVNSVKFFLDK
jgi:hypothetical protein